MNVVVLSCGPLGAEVAASLTQLAGLSRVTLVTAPYRAPRRPRSLTERAREVYRMQGPAGLVRIVGRRVLRRQPAVPAPDLEMVLPATVAHLRFADFHAPEAIEAVKALDPDLGVLAGTYILKESVFGIPRQGCINLHSGKVPEYRGAAPAFWELYNGEREVGVTIHRVVAALDAGAVLAATTVPINPTPDGDPVEYIERYRLEVLRPEGVRLLTDVVAAIADGSVSERPQDGTNARTYRTPEYRHIRELRRRVRQRRRKKLMARDAT